VPKKFSFLLLILVILISASVFGQTVEGELFLEERELSLEEASRILSDFLAGRKDSAVIDPQAVEPVIEIVGFVEPASSTLYYVRPGDTLYKIARSFNTTIAQIKRDNNLYSDYLYVGQKLYINNSTNNVIYTVKAGDTLYKLAERYNTNVKEIRNLNNLYSDYLYIGQHLIIPVKNVQRQFTYYVQPGDTLYKIASRYGTTVQNIRASNNLYTDYLYVGQRLFINLDGQSGGYQGNRLSVTEEELELLARAVYSEARGEIYEGQVAVAAVIINRIFHPLFPDSIREVIFQPWQFTAVHDGQFWLQPNQRSYQAAKDALDGWDPTGGAIYYYNPRTATSSWVFYRQVVVKIGQHYFAI